MQFVRLEDRTNTIYLAQPVHDLAVGRIHVNAEKMQREVLPAGESVASRIIHCRWTSGTVFLCDRRHLLTKRKSRLDTFTPSASFLSSERRYRAIVVGFNSAVDS